jgi:bifunctional non-homologous end joining protein LigD
VIPLPKPMKAVAGQLPEDDDGWAYEIKWDGMRVVTGIDGGVRGESTRGHDVMARFPELEGLGDHLAGHQVVLDGEVVAFDGLRTDFGRLQQRMHIADRREALRRAADVPVVYVVFDLLHLDGIDTMPLPYEDRRRLLLELVEPGPGWTIPAHQIGDGAALKDAAAAQGLEGVVAKRLASRYEPGRRSPAWRKVKVRRVQELVVGGWTRGEGNREGSFGGLLVGYHAEGDPDGPLEFAGSVGTGFDQAELARVLALLEAHATDRSPFRAALPKTIKGVRWAEPAIVVQVEFAEWTSEGRLRHPAYLGQRIDKDPSEVIREPT